MKPEGRLNASAGTVVVHRSQPHNDNKMVTMMIDDGHSFLTTTTSTFNAQQVRCCRYTHHKRTYSAAATVAH
jgi:hypothetical protein